MNRTASRAASRAASLPLVATRAPITVTAARPGGAPSEDDLARINALARAPLDASSVYVFPAEISNESIDAYYTRMTPKSLAQFAQDASRGVAVCDSHQHYQLPLGRSFYGTVATGMDGTQATQSLAYMLRGMRTPSGMSTDDIIRGVEAGINADVSIGFIPDAYWCSICGLNMLEDWDCMHWPGQTYDIRDPKTGIEQSDVLCVADVDARLAEYSLVYDGATPNAMVLKAEAALDSGRAVTAEVARQIRLVEDHCRVKLIERWQGYGSGARWNAAANASPSSVPTSAPLTPLTTAPTTTEEQEQHDREFDTMRGSEFLGRYMDTVQAEATRVGKQVSQANLDRLTGMRDKLAGGHDTMDEALRELASFIDDVSDGSGGDTDGDGDNPEGGNDPDHDGRSRPATPALSATPEAPDTRAPSTVEVRADGNHDPMTGTHTHSHPAFGSQGDDATHSHEHSHDGDANHDHSHTENAGPSTTLVTAPGDGLPKRGIEISAADGKMRSAHLDGHDHLTTEQRAVYELGERVFKQAQDEAMAWAVRAGVVKTPEDEQRYRGMLARCAYDDVATFRAGWEQIAKANLSPRGRWTPDPKLPGGGKWDDAPTLEGGRQTAAADPNDPQRIAASSRRVATGNTGGALPRQTARSGDDAALYTVAGSGATRNGRNSNRRAK